jgi:hypothetical protein
MTDPRLRLRTPWLAGILAFLVPGLGHLFQGRVFKALVYSTCICGMFYTGMRLADWQAVQAPPFAYREKGHNLLMLKFAAQLGVGLPSIGCVVQSRRLQSRENQAPTTLPQPVVAPFTGGFLKFGLGERPVTGTITLEPVDSPRGESIAGRFEGTTAEGEKVELILDYGVDLQRPVDAQPNREVTADVVAELGKSSPVGRLIGTIPRRWQDWLGVPLGDEAERDLEGRLGKWHELAVVLTWIAGLLNMLAIWDAFEGPAYGYSDQAEPEPSEPQARPQTRPVQAARQPASAV